MLGPIDREQLTTLQWAIDTVLLHVCWLLKHMSILTSIVYVNSRVHHKFQCKCANGFVAVILQYIGNTIAGVGIN